MGLKGNIGSLKGLKQTIRALPTTIAADVSKRAAPAMTELTRDAFGSNRNVYGDTRPAGVDGAPLTLHKTGAVESALRFVAIGTITRCVLGPKYARYLIGKYGILPNGALPAAWSRKLGELVAQTKVPL